MNNQEFANQIADYLFTDEDYNNHVKEVLPLFLSKHNLQIIDTRDTLVSFCVEDVILHYEEFKNNNPTNLIDFPDKLTIEQARWILARADYNNSKHEDGLDWDEIELAIDEWLEEGCPDYA